MWQAKGILTENWGCNCDGNFLVKIWLAMIIKNCGEIIIVEKIVEKFAEKIVKKNVEKIAEKIVKNLGKKLCNFVEKIAEKNCA